MLVYNVSTLFSDGKNLVTKSNLPQGRLVKQSKLIGKAIGDQPGGQPCQKKWHGS